MRIYLSCVFFLLLFQSTYSQIIQGPVVIHPVYFDLSPPLVSLPMKRPVKADQTWKDGIVKNQFNFLNSLKEEKINPAGALQDFFGVSDADTLLLNFEGTGNVNYGLPPDPYGEIGVSHYFQIENYSFTLYDRSGNILFGPVDNSTLWNGLPGNYNSGDGIVLYDEQADRWLVAQLSIGDISAGPYYIMIAVSQTPDPAGSWYRWEYQFANLADYPKFGVWPDGYYFSCNMFNGNNLSWSGPCMAVFDRQAMLAGNPNAARIDFFLSSTSEVTSPLPSDCDGPFPPYGTPNIIGYLNYSRDYIGLYEFHTDWQNTGNSTLTNIINLTVPAFSWYINHIPQKGTSVLLEPITDRLMYRLQYRNFGDHQALVVNHTVGAGDHAGIRWYELRKINAGWFIYQQSTYSPDSNSRWMGSVAMDSDGDMALGYSVSGTNLYPSIRYTGRMKDDPLNRMTIRERSVIEGNGYQSHLSGTSSRWGDYSSMTTDPIQGKTFWYTQEYYPETSDIGWHTRIASLSFANILDVQAEADPSVVCSGDSTVLNAKVSGGTVNNSYTWTSLPEGFYSAEKNPVVFPSQDTRYILTVVSGSQEKSDTVNVSVLPAPVVDAGSDGSYCWYIPRINVYGSAANFISLQWSSSGDGSFDDPLSSVTFYMPGPSDRSHFGCDLKLTAYPQFSCPPAFDMIHISLDSCLGIQEESQPFQVIRVYPNPFTDKTNINFSVPGYSSVEMTVQDLLGNQIKNLASSKYPSGRYEISWDGTNNNGKKVPPGIYIIRMYLNGVLSGIRKAVVE